MTVPAGIPCLEILDAGVLSTVQDAGRPGLGSLGITRGGAADAHALMVANALLGNAGGAAALELTLAGARLRALERVTLAVAGADLGAHVVETGEAVTAGRTVELRAGGTLAFDGRQSGGPAGCRAYVAVPGGIGVPLVLGSRATALGAGYGGLDGRALRAGDVIAASEPGTGAPDDGAGVAPRGLDRPPAQWIGPVTDPADGPFRVLAGPHAGDGDGRATLSGLVGRPWTVSPASDRMGLRLAGDPLPAPAAAGESQGVIAGTVQLPPDGRPIVLLADHQPTGGYPVIAIVASADRARLGQLAPGATATFETIEEPAARRLASRRRAAIEAALGQLRDAQAWDALWRGAGG